MGNTHKPHSKHSSLVLMLGFHITQLYGMAHNSYCIFGLSV